MGKLKEKFLGVETVEYWQEVETAALLGLPDERSLSRRQPSTAFGLLFDALRYRT